MKDYIGRFVKQFESGTKGSLALGSCGNDWGLSCGSYQLTLRWGNCIRFLEKYYHKEASKLYFNKKPDIAQKTWPGKEYCSLPDEVKAIWMECYNKDPDLFIYNEHQYIKAMYYEPLLKQSPIQPTNRAMQECLWALAVHKGVGGALFILNVVVKKKYSNDTELFNAIYDERYQDFPYNRYSTSPTSEREVLRAYLKQPPLKEGDCMSEYKKLFTVNEFLKKLQEICNKKTAYVFGAVGEPITAELIDRKAKEQPLWYTAERTRQLKAFADKNYYGFDCSNLLKALFWGWTGSKLTNGKYFHSQSNTVPDQNADGLFALCTDIFSDLSRIEVGEALWFKGHIGIYVGNGNVIDCTPSLNKVCVNAMSRQKWLKHGKLPWINYNSIPVSTVQPVSYTVKKGDTLTKIAKEYHTTVTELVKRNGIKDQNLIQIGQVLKIK